MAAPGLAFLAGMGQGYLKAKDRAADDERREKFDRIILDRADREAKKFARMERNRGEIEAATKPVEPVSGEVFMPEFDDEGNRMPANPTAGTFKVGDQRFATMTEAQKAAEAANTPDAQNERVLAVMRRQDPTKAVQLQTTLMQGKAAGLQLEKGQMDLANQKFDQALSGLDSHEGIAQAIGELGTNVQARPSADGKKVEYWRIGADGAATKTPYAFDNTPDGIRQAKLEMSRSVPLSSKIEFAWNREKAKQDQVNKDRDFSLAKSSQDQTAAYRAATLSLDKRRVSMAEAAHAAENRLPPAVKAQFGALDKQLQTVASAIAKAQAEGSFDPNSPGAQSLMAQQVVLSKKMGDLLAPHLGGEKPAGDPFGLFTEQARPGGAEQVDAKPGEAKPRAEPKGVGQKIIATMTGRRPLFDNAPATSPVQAQLDSARQAVEGARQKLQSYGLRQRSADPDGFVRARQALATAEQAEKQALAQYQRSVKSSDLATMR